MMRIISILGNLAFSLILISYDIRLLGGYFQILPRICYLTIGILLFIIVFFEIYNEVRIGGPEYP